MHNVSLGAPTKLFKNIISVNDNDEHQTINNFLLTAPKILILGSKNRA